ncbi:MAG: pyridoxamine 5'-phosphate oxidase family protein, partial [Pseudomonadota bacterium]
RWQAENGSAASYVKHIESAPPDALGPAERAFIADRVSFYISSVSASGWPYVQHRGGPRGFLHVLGPTQLGFADYRGNRQFISAGNTDGDTRVALILMDYFNKRRLKLLGHARFLPLDKADPTLAATLSATVAGPPERIVTIDLTAADWNCPQFIPELYEGEAVKAVVGGRIAALEAENARLKAELAALQGGGDP